LHEWISDSGETPHIVVDAAAEGVTVPRQYVKDGKIVLNVSFSATQMLKLGNDFVSFEARFGGVGFAVQVPVRAILGIYARETGQGMIFPEGDADPDPRVRLRENNMSELTRRQFMKITGMSLVGSSLALMGFSPEVALAEVREYKLSRATETRNTCPYCSVACGILMYSLGDGAKNAHSSIFHIEGDADHPVNRGTLCPKGAGLIDFIHSESRLKFPEYRAPGADQWQRMSWDEALDRIAKLMKQDRDANFVAKTADGLTVNRWLTTGMLAASASSNEVGYLTAKVVRSLGMLAFDNQARV
jgi:formate dehydrogenase major subunit